jgi:hypothetical protein
LTAAQSHNAAFRRPRTGVFLGIQTDYGFGGGGDWYLCTAAPLVADLSGGDGGVVPVRIDIEWSTHIAGLRMTYELHD